MTLAMYSHGSQLASRLEWFMHLLSSCLPLSFVCYVQYSTKALLVVMIRNPFCKLCHCPDPIHFNPFADYKILSLFFFIVIIDFFIALFVFLKKLLYNLFCYYIKFEYNL
jgi:hypothetical protein